jgi:hypothetical protein
MAIQLITLTSWFYVVLQLSNLLLCCLHGPLADCCYHSVVYVVVQQSRMLHCLNHKLCC